MKRNVKLQLFSLTIGMAFLMTPFLAGAQTSKTNFTGAWVFNVEKSVMGEPSQGGGQRMGVANLDVTQDANLLSVVRTRTGQDGQPVTTTSKYTLDGKESINTSQRGDSKSVASWSADGKLLTIVTKRTIERDGQTMELTSTEVWNMTNTTTLAIAATMNTPGGERKTTAVYDKK
jgi:Tol biopolymer transport system component